MLTLISLADAARELGVDPSTLRHQLRAKRIRGVKVGHVWHLTPAEVERYRTTIQGRPTPDEVPAA